MHKDLVARGADAKAAEFTHAVAAAEAVINRYTGELQRLAWSDDQVYATYYQKVQAGLQLPGNDRWNRLRGIADAILFEDANKQHIRFASLSLDGVGVTNYGECSLVLKRSMIEHRASLFEENSVVFMGRRGVTATNDFEVPPGYRAAWARRADLCLAKLASRLQPVTAPTGFARLLLSGGATSADDNFVEVHIWGSLTIRSFQHVIVQRWTTKLPKAERLALQARLDHVGVTTNFP